MTVCSVTAGATGAAPAATPGGTATAAWAYGGLRSVGWTGSSPGFAYQVSETAGFAVILSETLGATSAHTLYANRTMGIIYSVEYCKPSCAHPTVEATVAYHAWESVRAILDLTTDGTVYVENASTAALALNSSSVAVAVGLHEAVTIVRNGTVTRSHNLTVGLQANSTTSFAPALGLVPLTPSSRESWNSTSDFTESGNANWSIVDRVLGLLPFTKTGTISLAQSGVAAINGSYGGTVRLAGSTFDALALSVHGPFVLREGFLLVPSGADLFGGSFPAWLTSAVKPNASANASESTFDVSQSVASGAHLGLGGSEMVWTSATANPAASVVAPAFSGGTLAEAGPASSPNSTAVQGGPEPLSQATTDENCLSSGVGCPASGTSRGPLGLLLVVGAAVVAAALVLVVVAERRRVPPPSYPNAALYPPAGRAGTPTGGGRRPGEPTPPTDDDPLGNLW